MQKKSSCLTQSYSGAVRNGDLWANSISRDNNLRDNENWHADILKLKIVEQNFGVENNKCGADKKSSPKNMRAVSLEKEPVEDNLVQD